MEQEILKDIDGNNYKTVKIGNQIWMAENLNVSRFRNGDIIPEVKSFDDWKYFGQNSFPAWCYNNNDQLNGAKYGKLYNFYAVNDPRGLAPEGWVVPSLEDYGELVSIANYGNTLKTINEWNINHGRNEFGFSALPGGWRWNTRRCNSIGYEENCDFYLPGDSCRWWTNSISDGLSKSAGSIQIIDEYQGREGEDELTWYYNNFHEGLYVRLLKK